MSNAPKNLGEPCFSQAISTAMDENDKIHDLILEDHFIENITEIIDFPG